MLSDSVLKKVIGNGPYSGWILKLDGKSNFIDCNNDSSLRSQTFRN